MGLSPRDTSILHHYSQFWGAPSRITRFDLDDKSLPTPILVAEFAPSRPDEDWVYATIGASDRPMSYPEAELVDASLSRMEVFVYSRNRDFNLEQALVWLASYPFLHRTFLGPAHTLAGEHGFLPDSPITDVLLLRPFGEIEAFEVIGFEDQSHSRLLWVVPIYPSERRFVSAHGWNALVEEFARQQTDTSDLFRAPVMLDR